MADKKGKDVFLVLKYRKYIKSNRVEKTALLLFIMDDIN